KPWDGDSRNHNKAYKAFVWAAGQGIDRQHALQSVVNRIRHAGGVVDPGDLQEQQRRAYDHVGATSNGDIAFDVVDLQFDSTIFERAASRVNIDDPAEFIRRRSLFAPETVTAAAFLEALYSPG